MLISVKLKKGKIFFKIQLNLIEFYQILSNVTKFNIKLKLFC